uniref:endomucin isoform X1 n=1 Tax=Jaculus jaculus TaxID=51337 RepID=UPI001E1B2365|nr:endomucin isoform X1 [Jaculus jaculus]XP_045000463.1 endomucin isoform X1 [Jaculus jaculus]
MQLPQVTSLFLFLSSSFCSCDPTPDVPVISTPVLTLPASSTTKTPVATTGTVSVPNLVIMPTNGAPPKGTTSSELSKMPLKPAVTSLTTVRHEETTTFGVTKNEVFTTKATVTDLLVSNVVSILPTSQPKTETHSSVKTADTSANIQPPDVLLKTTMLPSTAVTIPKNISPSQDTQDANGPTTAPIIPSYSSIILPVVIALIVITLLVFSLVGLYRMCWKKDPGTPENGNDQPQSDKESVKLLTVKTLSHETGEHSAQGKTKN